MRNILLAIMTGVLAGEALAFYRARTMKKARHERIKDALDLLFAEPVEEPVIATRPTLQRVR